MKVKELENLQPKKFVEIEEEFNSDIYSVSRTENGSQWATVFRGSLEKSIVIRDAFVKIGYKFLKGEK